MSGDSAGAAMRPPDAEPASGQQVRAEPASGQQGAGQGTADPASGQEGGAEPASGVAEQAAGRETAVSGTAVGGTAAGGTAVGGTAAGGTAVGGTAAGDTTPQSPEELSRAGWELPWAESPFGGAKPQERAELELAFATAMRRTGSLMQLMGQAAADRIGINNTDLNCLNILSFSGHMTAGELARATGLTTASITGVIDPGQGGQGGGERLRADAPGLAGDGGPILRRRTQADRRLLRAGGAGVPQAPDQAPRRVTPSCQRPGG